MNVNEIIEAVHTYDLRAAVAEAERSGHILTQAEMAAAVAAAAAGLLLCLFGLKAVRVWAALAGLTFGLAAGTEVSLALGLEGIAVVIAAAAAGILLALLGALLRRFSVFLLVFVSVGLCCIRLLDPQDMMMLGVCAGIALIFGILSIWFAVIITILATSLLGGMLCGNALYCLLPVDGAVIRLAFCAAFTILGIVVQLLFESRKRKKQNLKKAAEIRENNSTENEVERARALFDALEEEGEASEDEQAGEFAALGDDSGLLQVSLDELDDFDDELDEDIDVEDEDLDAPDADMDGSDADMELPDTETGEEPEKAAEPEITGGYGQDAEEPVYRTFGEELDWFDDDIDWIREEPEDGKQE